MQWLSVCDFDAVLHEQYIDAGLHWKLTQVLDGTTVLTLVSPEGCMCLLRCKQKRPCHTRQPALSNYLKV